MRGSQNNLIVYSAKNQNKSYMFTSKQNRKQDAGYVYRGGGNLDPQAMTCQEKTVQRTGQAFDRRFEQ